MVTMITGHLMELFFFSIDFPTRWVSFKLISVLNHPDIPMLKRFYHNYYGCTSQLSEHYFEIYSCRSNGDYMTIHVNGQLEEVTIWIDVNGRMDGNVVVKSKKIKRNHQIWWYFSSVFFSLRYFLTKKSSPISLMRKRKKRNRKNHLRTHPNHAMVLNNNWLSTCWTVEMKFIIFNLVSSYFFNQLFSNLSVRDNSPEPVIMNDNHTNTLDNEWH